MESKQINILLVDDDEDDFILTRELLKEFEHYNYSLAWVDNYTAGLEGMVKGEYDIYLVDYKLGGRDGLTLLREATALGCQAPVILLTGRGGYDIDLQAMAAGAVDYLVKDSVNGSYLERSIRYALERKQAEETIRREAARAEALLRIASRLNARLDLQTVLQAVCEESCRAINSNAASIYVYDPQNDSYHLKTAYGFEADTARQIPPLYLTIKGPVDLLPKQVQITAGGLGESSSSTRIFSQHGITTVLSVGIVCNGTIYGVLDLYDTGSERVYSGEEIALLIGLVDQAALAISNSLMYEQEQERNRELAAVAHISNCLGEAKDSISIPPIIESEIPSLVSSSWARVIQAKGPADLSPAGFVVESDLLPENVDPHLLSEAMLNGETVALPGTGRGEEQGEQVVIVPLQAETEMLGLLATGRSVEQPFTKAEIQLLASVGKVAGSWMYRTRLFEDSQRRLQHTQALHEIDLAIASTLDLRLTLKTALKQVIQQLGVDAAAVFLLNKETGELEYSISWGFRTKSIQRTRPRLGKGFSGMVAAEKKLLQKEYGLDCESDDCYFPDGEGFITYFGAPLVSKDEVNGVLEIYHRERLAPDPEWIGFLKTLAGQIAIAIDNALLFEGLQQSNADLVQAYDTALEGWSRALDLRDKETEGHTQRVTRMALQLASAMGIDQGELNQVRRGAMLHDIGKMAIPDRILHKPGPLTQEEWDIMRMHSDYAYKLLAPIPFLRSSLDIPYCHHERWDGTGYPRRLQGEEIPLAARIFAVIDVWDALLSNRPYRKAWSHKRAREYIRAQSGRHFDPRVGRTFLELVDRNAIGG